MSAMPAAPGTPEKPALEGLESKWGQRWEESGTYRFDAAELDRDAIYSIDTPPPGRSSRAAHPTTCRTTSSPSRPPNTAPSTLDKVFPTSPATRHWSGWSATPCAPATINIQ